MLKRKDLVARATLGNFVLYINVTRSYLIGAIGADYLFGGLLRLGLLMS